MIPFLCWLGIHARTYTPYWEHRIIDGPPRQFTYVRCTRCGETHESRDPVDLRRALKANRS